MFFFRRLRYMFSGKLIRGIFGIFSLLVVAIFVCLLLFGFINQRSIFTFIFNKTAEGGGIVAEEINKQIENNDDSFFIITDQGIYIRGFEPEGAGNMTSEDAGGIISDMKDTVEKEMNEAEIDSNKSEIENSTETNTKSNENTENIQE